MSNLIKLLQPPEYKSKLKLYCCNYPKNISYLCKVEEQKPQEEVRRKRIKIEEYEQN